MWCDRGLNELQRFKRLVKACVTETRWLNHRFNEFVWAGRGWHWGLCDVELFKSLHSLDLWSVCLSSRREDGDQDHWLPKVPEMWCGCGKTVDDPKTQTVDSRRGAWAEPPDRKRLLKLPFIRQLDISSICCSSPQNTGESDKHRLTMPSR